MPCWMETSTTRWLCHCVSSFNNRCLCPKLFDEGEFQGAYVDLIGAVHVGTKEYYQALKLRKVDSVLVRIQDEYHGAGTRHPSNRIRRMLYTETGFKKHKVPAAKADGEPVGR